MHFSGSVSRIVNNPFVFYKLKNNQKNLSMKKKEFFIYSLFYSFPYTSRSLYESSMNLDH